jgi:hypothetical protein
MSHIWSAALAMPWTISIGSPLRLFFERKVASVPHFHLGPATKCANSNHLCLNIDTELLQSAQSNDDTSLRVWWLQLQERPRRGCAVNAFGRSDGPRSAAEQSQKRAVSRSLYCVVQRAQRSRFVPPTGFSTNFVRHPCLRPIRRAKKNCRLGFGPEAQTPHDRFALVVRRSTVEFGSHRRPR